MASVGSRQLRVQDSSPAKRCGNENRTEHQGRDGGNSDGNRAGGGDGNKNKNGNGLENGSVNGDENLEKSRENREREKVQSGNEGKSEYARRRVTRTRNHQPQLKHPTPQRHRHIMRKVRAQGRKSGDKIREGGGVVKKISKLL